MKSGCRTSFPNDTVPGERMHVSCSAPWLSVSCCAACTSTTCRIPLSRLRRASPRLHLSTTSGLLVTNTKPSSLSVYLSFLHAHHECLSNRVLVQPSLSKTFLVAVRSPQGVWKPDCAHLFNK